MTFEQFNERILNEIEGATLDLCDERNVLDLRVFRSPYDAWEDNEVYCLSEIQDAWEFVKDADEWYVDVFENFAGENYAEYTGFSVASWE